MCNRNHLSESEKHRSNHVLRKSHSVAAGEECCFKFLPEGADTTEASVRTTIDDACREQIEAKIAAPPEPGASAVCRICKGLTRKTAVQVRLNLHNMRVPARPEEFVWHLRTWCVHCRLLQVERCALIKLRAELAAMGRSSRRGTFSLSPVN